MCGDLSEPQKKTSQNGISRLLLSLRTGLTMKPAEDIVMVLKNLAQRLNTSSQWQLAASQGYLELLAASFNHRYEEVRDCAFIFVMECLSNLSVQNESQDTLLTISWLLKLANEFVESGKMNSYLSIKLFETLAAVSSVSRTLRNEVLKHIPPSTLERIDLANLSEEAIKHFALAIHAVVTRATGNVPDTVPLLKILDKIAALSRLSCETSRAICGTLTSVICTKQTENFQSWLRSSKLIYRLAEHVASARCSDACSVAYTDLIEEVLLMDDTNLIYIGNFGLEALRVVIYERCIASIAQACRILARLLCGPSNHISLIVHYGLLSPLVILLADSDVQVRNEAKTALCNFMTRANFGHWYQAVQLGFVESLSMPLLSETADVVSGAIDVCFALMVSAKRAEIDSYVLQRMLNNEVDGIFAIMVFHADEKVASASQKFFDMYFREEFADGDIEQESSF